MTGKYLRKAKIKYTKWKYSVKIKRMKTCYYLKLCTIFLTKVCFFCSFLMCLVSESSLSCVYIFCTSSFNLSANPWPLGIFSMGFPIANIILRRFLDISWYSETFRKVIFCKGPLNELPEGHGTIEDHKSYVCITLYKQHIKHTITLSDNFKRK